MQWGQSKDALAPPLHFRCAMKNFLLITLAFVAASCGNNSALNPFLKQIRQPRLKRVLRPIIESKSAFSSRIINPKTPEDFAINEFQDMAEVHKRWGKAGYVFLNDQPDFATPDRPKIYSPRIILAELTSLKKEMPKDLMDIYLKKVKFPESRIFDPKVIEYWGKRINSGSEKARRWQQKMLPFMGELTKEANRDVRGYLFLKSFTDIQVKLETFATLEFSFQEKLKSALINICLNNNQKRSDCEQEIQDAIVNQKTYSMYSNYIYKAKEVYESYFKLRTLNSEGKFVDNVFNLTVTRPKDDAFAFFFRSVIEKSWTVEGKPIRQLAIKYVDYPKPDPTHVEVQNGVISHVEKDRKIVIDGDLDEFAMTKTLAHEFGHVLGFIDCYVEFYDEAKAEAVYYEIDSQNIMCSLNGQVTENHYQALLKSY